MILNKLFISDQQVPLKFGYEHRITETPFVMFVRKGQDTINDFYLDNPELEKISSKKGGGDLGEA